jgi:type IV pilus assembly protein PilE
MSRSKGFTLLELIVVVIIIGVLATLGFTQYTKLVERGRGAEAKTVLGQIRTAQEIYKQEQGNYSASMTTLVIDAPSACTTTNYFSYSVTDTSLAIATRCAASGKNPNSSLGYTISLTYSTATLGGSAGYY